MIVDATDSRAALSANWDICVVGGGVVGLAIAISAAKAGKRVCLLEAGGFSFSPQSQSAYDGHAEGTLLPEENRYLSESRLRQLGGSTAAWGGWCRPLDLADFRARHWIPDSGWPITLADVTAYYPQAYRFLGLRASNSEHDGDSAPLRQRDPDLTTEFWRRAVVRHYWEYWGRELIEHEKIQVIVNAPVLRLSCIPSGRRIERAVVIDRKGVESTLHAANFVLAAGGIENARLLLCSDEQHPNGMGNAHGNVGRYFMEHPHVIVGYALLNDAAWAAPYAGWRYAIGVGSHVHGALRLSDAVQEKFRLLNMGFTFIPISNPTSSCPQDIEDYLRACTQHFYPMSRAHISAAELRESWQPFHDQQVRRFGEWLRLAGSTGTNTTVQSEARIPGPVCAMVMARTEQLPKRENRVTLSRSTDGFRRRRADLSWSLTSDDVQSLRRSAKLLGNRIDRNDLGRLAILPEEALTIAGGACHHMGTTRMSRNPRMGVVDENLRVHGIDNLYVAGSSVFATSGWANPTLTGVALGLRLAEHLLSPAICDHGIRLVDRAPEASSPGSPGSIGAWVGASPAADDAPS